MRKSVTDAPPQRRLSKQPVVTKGEVWSVADYEKMDQKRTHMQESSRVRLAEAKKGLLEHREEERNVLDKRLEDNEKALKQALKEGNEFLDNIKISVEKRLVDRRKFEQQNDEKIKEFVANNAEICDAKFDEISERFADIRVFVDDTERLPKALDKQKRNIAALVAVKDETIEKLQDEFRRLESDYDFHILKQRNDMHILYERMNNHVEAMRTTFAHYLQLLQDTVDSERETLQLTVRRKFNDMHSRVDENLISKHRIEQEKRAFYEEQLARVQLEHVEATRASRLQLELDEQNVHLQLQQLRAHAVLNATKFDYNLQILTRKAEENVTIRNQMKRKLAECRDTVVTLRKKIADMQAKFEESSARCQKDVQLFHDCFMDLEKRSDRYARINETKFQTVWRMNEEEASALLKRVLATDRVLYEQQLGLVWTEPNVKLLRKTELYSYRDAMLFLHGDADHDGKPQKPPEHAEIVERLLPADKRTYGAQMLADTRVLRVILRQITEETDFLVEQKLMNLLRPYIKSEKMQIVQIDHIFQALGIQSMKDVSTLIKHFVPYTWCMVCSDCMTDGRNVNTERHRSSSARHSHRSSRKHSIRESERLAISVPTTARSSDQSEGLTTRDTTARIVEWKIEQRQKAEAELNRTIAAQRQTVIRLDSEGNINDETDFSLLDDISRTTADLTPTSQEKAAEAGAVSQLNLDSVRVTQCEQHTLVVEAGVEAGTTMAERLSCIRSTVSRLLNADDVDLFWRRYREAFNAKHRHLWDSLEIGLKEYLLVLKRREKLDKECQHLRKQNAELRRMLQPYLTQMHRNG